MTHRMEMAELTGTARDNCEWVTGLTTGRQQSAVLIDLRSALMKNLRAAFAGSSNVDNAFIEDIAQDAIIIILERIEQFEGRSRFLTWATAIAIRTAMTNLRRKHWQDLSIETTLEQPLEVITAPCLGPSEIESEQQRTTLITAMLNIINTDLSDKQRIALIAELRGVPQAELAEQLGGTRNGIYKLTHDARKSLKRGLEKAGFGPADIQFAFSQ